MKINTTYTESQNTLDNRENQKYEENEKIAISKNSTLKKTRTKMYERTKGDSKELPATTASIVIKQYILLL